MFTCTSPLTVPADVYTKLCFFLLFETLCVRNYEFCILYFVSYRAAMVEDRVQGTRMTLLDFEFNSCRVGEVENGMLELCVGQQVGERTLFQ